MALARRPDAFASRLKDRSGVLYSVSPHVKVKRWSCCSRSGSDLESSRGCQGFDQEGDGRGCEPGVSSEPVKSGGKTTSAKTNVFALPTVGGRKAAALAA